MDGFFPFGAANGDVVAPRVVDVSFGPILLDIPLVLFNNEETNVYVSSYSVTQSIIIAQCTKYLESMLAFPM